LGCEDAVDDAVHPLQEGWIVVVLQGNHRALEDLVKIGVEGMVSAQWTFSFTSGLVEVGDVPVFFKFVQRVRNRDLVCGLEARSPEATAQFHLRLPNFLEAANWWRVLFVLRSL
jgi:hypothetical protein